MKQTEFIIKVNTITEKDREKHYYFEVDGYKMIITAWHLCGKFLVESWITEMYPQLRQIGIDEMEKGEMYYKGDMKEEEFIDVLESWGFIMFNSEKHKMASAGLDVECRINPKDEIVENQLKERIEDLKKDLAIAIGNDDFESAIIIRDEISKLKNKS